MKSKFNKRQTVTFKKTDGHVIAVYRADIESVREAENPDHTILTFKKCESHPEGGELHLEQKLDDVIDRLNGVPSAEQKREWEREILKAIGRAAEDRLLQVPLERDTAIAGISTAAARIDKMLKDKLREEEVRQRSAQDAIASRNKSILSKTFGNTREYQAAIAYLAENKDTPDRIRNQIDVARAGHLRDQERLEDRYRREITFLENQARDPQMGSADRALLEQKIRDHRLGHMEPDFTFRRDPNNNSLARTESDLREMNRERAQELYDSHKRGRGLGLSRSRGYER